MPDIIESIFTFDCFEDCAMVEWYRIQIKFNIIEYIECSACFKMVICVLNHRMTNIMWKSVDHKPYKYLIKFLI